MYFFCDSACVSMDVRPGGGSRLSTLTPAPRNPPSLRLLADNVSMLVSITPIDGIIVFDCAAMFKLIGSRCVA